MRKGKLILIVVAAVGLVAYFFGHRYGLKFGGISLSLNKDKAELFEKANRFLECLKFKEFAEAGSYHHPDEDEKADIPKLIWQIFKVRHEQLDIQEWDDPIVEIDSTGKLAVTKTKTTVKLLNTKEIRDPEINFYWKKKGDLWYMYLRSSLPGQEYGTKPQK